jgi:hypothetical protein
MIGHFLDTSNVRAEYQLELRAYVISFCARVDLALHWLHYGRSGTGVAVGFDGTAVQRPPFDLFQVTYDPEEQHAIVNSVIEGTAECLQRSLANVSVAERDALIEVAATAAAGRLRAVVPLMKNSAFAGEEEWRLVTHDVRGPRVQKNHLTLHCQIGSGGFR